MGNDEAFVLLFGDYDERGTTWRWWKGALPSGGSGASGASWLSCGLERTIAVPVDNLVLEMKWRIRGTCTCVSVAVRGVIGSGPK
jgi:hypothetical protein